MSAPGRKMLLDPAHPRLSIRRQCSLLGLERSGVYRPARIKAYADDHEARAGIGAWFAFYNGTRPHQALAGRTPIAVWQAGTNSPGETAANMTLPPAAASLGDAFASPTCPPRQPQQQPLEAA
jgi:putative transposase